MSFGSIVKDLRIGQRKTLRQFCEEHGLDPSNWSKIERGVNPPPKDESTLSKWARMLGLERGDARHYNYLADKIRLVVDVYDREKYEGSRNYYDKRNPQTAKNKLGPPLA
jgi:transcriptional regulator with XRE-family HTH domain